MKVLFVAAECVPFVKTGGLADVVSSLPKALKGLGADVRILLPGYQALQPLIKKGREVARYGDLMGGPVRIVLVKSKGLTLLLIDAPHLYDRPGNPYVQSDGTDWPDNHLRFGALCRVGADIARFGVDGWLPGAVHCHDWHAGLTPAYLAPFDETPPTMMSIHNILYQGLFSASVRGDLGLPEEGFSTEGYEYYGKVGFLKAGLAYADRVTTVSPTYAKELLTPEFGFGLEGMLAHRGSSFIGILNGIDTETWDPVTDKLIAGNYRVPNKKVRAVNRRTLEQRFGLGKEQGSPLFCVISRLTPQKGLDLLLEALPALLQAGGRLAVLGTGDAKLENAFRAAASDNPGRVATIIGYDEALAHLMHAGSDAIVVPSRFEPCGLTQLCGLRYGCVPVTSVTGGLADTVIDADRGPNSGTGFTFQPTTAERLEDALLRAVECHRDTQRWRQIMARGMRKQVGWDTQARTYLDIYKKMLREQRIPA